MEKYKIIQKFILIINKLMKKITLDFDIYNFSELPEYWQTTFIAEYCNDHRDWIYNNSSEPELYAKNELANSEQYLFFKNNEDDFEQINVDDIEYSKIPVTIMLSKENFKVN